MMFLLLLPAALWIISCQLMTRAEGQKGFDRFFWQFVLLALEVAAALLLLRFFQVPSANRIVIGIVSGHSTLLLMWASGAYLRNRWRNRQGQARTA